MCANYYDYYDGSSLCKPLADKVGLPIDLVNFLVAQTSALCLARLFRKSLATASPELRHTVCLMLGLVMGYFCFGKQAIHLAVLPMLTYLLIRLVTGPYMGNLVLAVSMLYLSCLHLHRQIYHTADYSLDITGPLMVVTQRVTSLAYLIMDSRGLACKMNGQNGQNWQNGHGLKRPLEATPSPLEYFGYTLAFQTLMCGPVVFYSDYIDFINRTSHEHGKVETQVEVKRLPSPRSAVLYKMAGSLAAALLYISLVKKFSLVQLNELLDPASEVSRTWSTLYLAWYAYLSTLVVRCKYYHAWLLADAICNNSGMGFNGYDSEGRARWDHLSNVDVVGFELAQNFRSAVSSWNKNTNSWLRAVAYERGGSAYRTLRVYALSAVWHGFYPGYYLTFVTGGLFTVAARKIRAVARPVFVRSAASKLLYDTVTFATTRVAMTYATVPFVVLHLGPSLAFYGKFYYSLHFLALGALFLPAKGSRKDREDKPNHTFVTSSVDSVQNGSNGKLHAS